MSRTADWVPFRTGFHERNWGFCLSHRQFAEFETRGDDQAYDVLIDATYREGSLTYGELLLPGETSEEVLISAHICHPSLANDGLSGVAIAAMLARQLQQQAHRLSYRFVFAPATIGAITWLALNERHLARIRHGFILPVVGDPGPFHWRRSRIGNSIVDRAAEHVLPQHGSYQLLDFEPFGYDQRQYCSPGINLPIGCLMRTPNGAYPEYHTSADNLSLICPRALEQSLDVCRSIIDVLEGNAVYLNQKPMCEPRLGQHGLYHAYGSAAEQQEFQRAVLWTLNLSDGHQSLLEIAERSGLPFRLIRSAANALLGCGLLAAPESASAGIPKRQPDGSPLNKQLTQPTSS